MNNSECFQTRTGSTEYIIKKNIHYKIKSEKKKRERENFFSFPTRLDYISFRQTFLGIVPRFSADSYKNGAGTTSIFKLVRPGDYKSS